MSSPSRKRKVSPGLVSNPFVKKRNLEWSIVLPPPSRDAGGRRPEAAGQGASARPSKQENDAQTGTEEGPEKIPRHGLDQDSEQGQRAFAEDNTQKSHDGPSTSALIENNTVKITDHLGWFSSLLAKSSLEPFPEGQPRLTISGYRSLYNRSFQSPAGAHFVVTQHDHPIAGPHYDLRLQINGDSSCSWAIMYGYVHSLVSALIHYCIPSQRHSDQTQEPLRLMRRGRRVSPEASKCACNQHHLD